MNPAYYVVAFFVWNGIQNFGPVLYVDGYKDNSAECMRQAQWSLSVKFPYSEGPRNYLCVTYEQWWEIDRERKSNPKNPNYYLVVIRTLGGSGGAVSYWPVEHIHGYLNNFRE